MGMKKIVLARMWPRIGAGFVDFLLTTGLFALIYFAAVYPNVLDKESYVANQSALKVEYVRSGLYLENGDSLVDPTSAKTYETIDEVNSTTVTYKSTNYSVSLSKNLYLFYTEKASSFGEKNMTPAVFDSSILQLGTADSNIASFDRTTYALTLTDASSSGTETAVDFFLDRYSDAISIVGASPSVSALDDSNKAIMRYALYFTIPVYFGAGLIFEFLIPLFSRNGKSVGKWIFHLVLLDKDGYELKRIWLLPRFLSYIVVEIIGGVISFGSTFMITYTMAQFGKKHRSFHDYCGNSVVADERESLWFLDRVEEKEYEERHPELARQ